MWFVALFLVGAGVSAGLCVYLGLPLIYSAFGGLGLVALAFGLFLALQLY